MTKFKAPNKHQETINDMEIYYQVLAMGYWNGVENTFPNSPTPSLPNRMPSQSARTDQPGTEVSRQVTRLFGMAKNSCHGKCLSSLISSPLRKENTSGDRS
jgi:hypothetical protein